LIWLLLLALGVGIGFIAGFLGAGGGLLLVPVFLEVMPHLPGVELPVKTSLGTSHAVVLLIQIAAIRTQARFGGTDWTTVLRMSVGILFGALLGGYLATLLPPGLFRYFFAAFLSLVATRMVLAAYRPPRPPPERLPGRASTVAAGAGIGAFASFFGIGGGVLNVPYLLRFHGKSMHDTLATSSGLISVTAGVSLVSYVINGWGISGESAWLFGYVHLGAAAATGVGSLAGSNLGVRVRRRASRKTLFHVFTLLLVCVILRMLFRG